MIPLFAHILLLCYFAVAGSLAEELYCGDDDCCRTRNNELE